MSTGSPMCAGGRKWRAWRTYRQPRRRLRHRARARVARKAASEAHPLQAVHWDAVAGIAGHRTAAVDGLGPAAGSRRHTFRFHRPPQRLAVAHRSSGLLSGGAHGNVNHSDHHCVSCHRARSADLDLLGFFYVIVGILYGAADGIVNYNLYGRAINVVPFLVAGFGTAFVVIVVFLGTRRGPHLPPAESVIAEEAHGSPFWAFIMVLPCVFFTTLAVLAPSRAVKLVMILPTLLLLMAVIMAGSGFRYIFTQTGLEIRTLGFRLRSIPASQIRNYAVESWS